MKINHFDPMKSSLKQCDIVIYQSKYSAVSISCVIFSPNNSEKTRYGKGCLLWVHSLNKVLAFFLSYLCSISCYIQLRYIKSKILISIVRVNTGKKLSTRYISSLTRPSLVIIMTHLLNTSRPRQDGRHFPDNIFQCIFLNKNILIDVSMKFAPKGPMNNIPVLVQIMAWGRSGDKPLSVSMMISLPMHICVTRPQWVNLVTVQAICFTARFWLKPVYFQIN